MKNRETYMIEYTLTKLTKLTEWTFLLVSTNWIFYAKPSSTKPSFFFLTFFLSLLSLPPFSTQSIFLISCSHYYHICSLFYLSVTSLTCSKSNLSLSPPSSASTVEVNHKVMAINTPNTEISSSPPPSQFFYLMLMPYLEASGSPFFEETNISKFLERFENMCNNYQMSNMEKIRHLPWYYEIFTIKHV